MQELRINVDMSTKSKGNVKGTVKGKGKEGERERSDGDCVGSKEALEAPKFINRIK